MHKTFYGQVHPVIYSNNWLTNQLYICLLFRPLAYLYSLYHATDINLSQIDVYTYLQNVIWTSFWNSFLLLSIYIHSEFVFNSVLKEANEKIRFRQLINIHFTFHLVRLTISNGLSVLLYVYFLICSANHSPLCLTVACSTLVQIPNW